MSADSYVVVNGKEAHYVVLLDEDGIAVPGGTVELGATSLAALESITATGPLTDTQLRATAVPVSSTDGANVTQGAKADTVWDGAAASPTVVALLKRLASAIKAENATHTSGDLGFPGWGVINTGLASLASNGQYTPIALALTGQPYVLPGAATVGGCTPSKTVSTASTNATSVKASAGQVYGIHATNLNAAVRYLKLYNKATAPTVGTDVPVLVYAIPAGGQINVSIPVGVTFATGIAFALTTGIDDTDTGAVSASEHIVSLFYK